MTFGFGCLGFVDILGILVISGNNPELWPGRGIQRGLLEAIVETGIAALLPAFREPNWNPYPRNYNRKWYRGWVTESQRTVCCHAQSLMVEIDLGFGAFEHWKYGWKWKYLNSCCRPEPQPIEYFELRSSCGIAWLDKDMAGGKYEGSMTWVLGGSMSLLILLSRWWDDAAY